MRGGVAVLRPVHRLLGMLDAHAHRERLLLHRHARRVHGLERIARRMPAGQNHAPRSHPLRRARAPVEHVDARHRAARETHACKLRMEAHLAARVLDLTAHRAHHVHQQIGADVRLRLPKDLLGRAGVHEPAQHVARHRVLDVRGQLSVRERARAALAELDVRLRVEIAARRERVHRGQALVHVAAALEHERPQPGPRQIERAEQPGRARAHHDRARLAGIRGRRSAQWHVQRLVRLVALHVRSHDRPSAAARDGDRKRSLFGRLVDQLHAERRHEMDVALLARVHAALHRAHRAHIAFRHPQRRGRRRAHERPALGQPRVKRQLHVRNLKHDRPPPSSGARRQRDPPACR